MIAALHSSSAVLVVAVFLSSAVEMVEALTIVIAVGTTRGFKSALFGALAAIVVLSVGVAAIGPTLIDLVHISLLRSFIGLFLLYFGSTWLYKAILRSSGRKAMHDEDAIYSRTVEELAETNQSKDLDRVGLLVAFKGVLVEGLEVLIVVVTLGSASHELLPATISAIFALVIVGGIGLAVVKPLAKVPENTMKKAVGIMLVSFGTFWIGEGLSLHWPGSDLALLVLIAIYTGIVQAIIAIVSRRLDSTSPVGG